MPDNDTAGLTKVRPNKLLCPHCTAKIDKRAPNAAQKMAKHIADHANE
jgi:hypothetical protein